MSLRWKERRIDSFGSRARRNSKEASTRRSAVALPPYFASSRGLTLTSYVDLLESCSIVTRYFALPADWTEIFRFHWPAPGFGVARCGLDAIEFGNVTFGAGKSATG